MGGDAPGGSMRGRKTERIECKAYLCKVSRVGTSGGVKPSIPAEYIGRYCIVTILPEGVEINFKKPKKEDD